MIKNNVWNRIFHHKKLEVQEDKYLESQKLIGLGPETLQFIKLAQDLNELLEAHKKAWDRGYRNSNLGPCEWGIFRTKDISTMSANEVFLGNVFGLWTFNIPYWNEHSEDVMGVNSCGIPKDVKCYSFIVQQYRLLLKRNVEAIIRESKEYCTKFDKEV